MTCPAFPAADTGPWPARDAADRVHRIRQLQRTDARAALRLALDEAGALGAAFPAGLGWDDAIEVERRSVLHELAGAGADDALGGRALVLGSHDPLRAAQAAVLHAMPCCAGARHVELRTWCCLRALHIGLTQGRFPELPAVAMEAAGHFASIGDFESMQRLASFAHACAAVSELDRQRRAELQVLEATQCAAWSSPLESVFAQLQEALPQLGDDDLSSMVVPAAAGLGLVAAGTLDDVLAWAGAWVRGDGTVPQGVAVVIDRVMRLQGTLAQAPTLDLAAQDLPTRVLHLDCELIGAVTENRWDHALVLGRERTRHAVGIGPIEAWGRTAHALAVAVAMRRHDQRRSDAALALRRELSAQREWLAARAERCPGTFGHLLALVTAASAWADQAIGEAMSAVDAAIRAARRDRHRLGLAWSAELAASFCRAHHLGDAASTYHDIARRAYASWGAGAKLGDRCVGDACEAGDPPAPATVEIMATQPARGALPESWCCAA